MKKSLQIFCGCGSGMILSQLVGYAIGGRFDMTIIAVGWAISFIGYVITLIQTERN